MKNLKDLMISISEFKVQMSEIIKNKVTKVIVKNNEPVAVIMPYAEYIERAKDSERIEQIGQDITLQNGVQMMVTVSKEKDDSLCIKTYVKMKTTGDYKLHFTHHIAMPTIESTMTTKEIIEFYERNDN